MPLPNFGLWQIKIIDGRRLQWGNAFNMGVLLATHTNTGAADYIAIMCKKTEMWDNH